MNDSTEAFQSPKKISKGIRSLAVRRKNCPVSKRFKVLLNKDNLIEQNLKANKFNLKADDTLYNVDDLGSDKGEEVNDNKTSSCKDQKVSPSIGYCSICKKTIPKAECPTHYTTCLNKTFSSKYSMKLSSVVVCSTCGCDIQVVDYTAHVEACSKSNIEAAKRLSVQGDVTSSYFADTITSEFTSKNFCCPSCGTNLTSLNNVQRTRHVNVCLDNSRNKPLSSTAGQSCQLCKKIFKSARGLKLHSRVCTGNKNQSQAKQKRKVRAPKNSEEDLLQLAKGLSASDHLAEKMSIKQEKRRKREIPIPSMLQVTDSSRRVDLEARLESLVSDAHSSESEIISTPPLPGRERWNVGECLSKQSPSRNVLSDNVQEISLDPSSDSNVNDDVNDVNEDSYQEEISSDKQESLVTKKLASKWGLGRKQSSDNADFRVSGLLSQFDRSHLNHHSDEDQSVKEDVEQIDSTLRCLMDLQEGASEEDEENKHPLSPNPIDSFFIPNTPLHSDISALLDQPTYSDLKLIFSDGFLHVHKCILSVRSPRLLEVLESRRDDNNCVHMNGLMLEDTEIFFSHLYSGSLEKRNQIQESCRILETNLLEDSGSRSPLPQVQPQPPPCASTSSPVQTQSSPVLSSSALSDDQMELGLPRFSPVPTDDPTAMSDDDLFSSFTRKSRGSVLPLSEILIDSSSNEGGDDQSCGAPSSDEELVAFNLSHLITSSQTPFRKSTARGALEKKRGSLSQPIMRGREQSPLSGSPLCDAQCQDEEEARHDSRMFKTPAEVKKLRSFQPVVSITPMPAFSDMDTPEIINRGRKIGLKKNLGKRKIKVKLKEVHAYTHQVDSSEDEAPVRKSEPTSLINSGSRKQDEMTSRDDITSDDSSDDVIPVTSPVRPFNSSQKKEIEMLSSDCDASDDDVIPITCPDENRKKEQRRATAFLDALCDEEFERTFKQSIVFLHEKDILMKALKREDDFMKGTPIGSMRDLELWMQRMTPGHKHFRREWPILMNLSQRKQQVLVEILSEFISTTPHYSAYLGHDLFGILPVIYRAVIKFNRKFRCLSSS